MSNDVKAEEQSQAHPIKGEYTLVSEPVLKRPWFPSLFP